VTFLDSIRLFSMQIRHVLTVMSVAGSKRAPLARCCKVAMTFNSFKTLTRGVNSRMPIIVSESEAHSGMILHKKTLRFLHAQSNISVLTEEYVQKC